MTSVTVTPSSVRINNLEIDNEETVKIMAEIEEKELEQYIVNSINIGASVLRNRMTTEKIDYVEKEFRELLNPNSTDHDILALESLSDLYYDGEDLYK